MITPEHQPDQQQYWSRNLDPRNLGSTPKTSQIDYPRERRFHLTPDQKYALREFGSLNGKYILELGAGLGINSVSMSESGAIVIAIDPAHDRLQAIARSAPQVNGGGRIYLIKATAEALPFRQGAFDHAFSKAVMIHTQLEQAVPEIHRVMKDGASAVFLEPMAHNPLVKLYRKTLAPRIWQDIARYFTRKEIDLFCQTFKSTRVEYFYLFSFVAFAWQFAIPVATLFHMTLKPMHYLDRRIMRLYPGSKQLAWFTAISVRK